MTIDEIRERARLIAANWGTPECEEELEMRIIRLVEEALATLRAKAHEDGK